MQIESHHLRGVISMLGVSLSDFADECKTASGTLSRIQRPWPREYTPYESSMVKIRDALKARGIVCLADDDLVLLAIPRSQLPVAPEDHTE